MPGQIRRALIGDGTGFVRIGITSLLWVRLDGLGGQVQIAILDGASAKTDVEMPLEGGAVWIQAISNQPITGWRIIAESLPVA